MEQNIKENSEESKAIESFQHDHVEIETRPVRDTDYSKEIFHVTQAGMQCWARSSQMFLSYILNQLGFSKGQIGSIFYKKMFLDKQSDKEYEINNQYIL